MLPSSQITEYRLVTERPLPRDSRVERCEVRLRDWCDARDIGIALTLGTLRPKPGVRCWTERFTVDAL